MNAFSFILSIVGAAAWIPIIVNYLIETLRKVHFVYLDRRIIFNATDYSNINGKQVKRTGMDIILGLNLFVYGKPFFPKNISCEIKLKDGPVHKASIYNGTIGYNDLATQQHHTINVSPNFNMSINRSIQSNIDNIRILAFFIENLNLQTDENIEFIKIYFKGRFFKKKIILNSNDCVKIPIIQSFDSIDLGGNR